jgi:hypothetical protein
MRWIEQGDRIGRRRLAGRGVPDPKGRLPVAPIEGELEEARGIGPRLHRIGLGDGAGVIGLLGVAAPKEQQEGAGHPG